MLGIFLIYWVGKQFYTLAQGHERNAWGYAILGVVSYYLGTIVFAFGYVLLNSEGLESIGSGRMIDLISIPFGALSCWLFYQLLKNRFEKALVKTTTEDSNILDDIFIEKY